MSYWLIQCGNCTRGIMAMNFGDACRKLGFDWSRSKVISCN